MLDVGAWGEFVLILILALIIIGPKDLPKVLYTIGNWVGKIRRFGYDAHTTLTILMNQHHPYESSPPPPRDLSSAPESPSPNPEQPNDNKPNES